ncbi:hypothetical protein AVEN_75299-1 [Araneus ventricosus]|uniref:Uncharacterized protein n=1 Tax=Araneus ventricosus TaxID=182803 RepID=A0A4Y2G240_ARAVE|nr:hypothetical protein AVEN_75299-1 [Araneus ventricosus]
MRTSINMKHFAGNVVIAVAFATMLLGAVMVPGSEAAPHHHEMGGGGGIAELLAAGLVIDLIRHHHGRRRRSVEEHPQYQEEHPVAWQ